MPDSIANDLRSDGHLYTAPELIGDDVMLPSYVRPEWRESLPDLQLLYRMLAGTRKMHSYASEYIRQWRDEADSTFRIRSTIEQVFEGLGRTLSASVGMLFAHPPAIEWVRQSEDEGGSGKPVEKSEKQPKTEFEKHWENIDGGGTRGDVFVKQFVENSIRDGLGLILVDFSLPQRDESGGVREIRADEEHELNLRPTWARYDRECIRNWRTSRINNKEEITLLTLYEPAILDDGPFGVKLEHRWRVLRLVKTPEGMVATWELWALIFGQRGNRDNHFKRVGNGVFVNANGEIYDTLPIAIAYTGRKLGPLNTVPPLMGVAWANLGLWQISSNHRFYLDLACFPQPTIIGDFANSAPGGVDVDGNRIIVPGKLKVGPMVAVHLSAGNSDSGASSFAYTTPPSDGFEPNERAMVKKREDMAALGMSFLQRDKRQAETAEAKRLDATAENATLATAAQAIDDATNLAWRHHAWFLGYDPEAAPMMTLNRDFESVAMSSQVMSAWISGVEKAGLPAWVLLQAWQRGGQIPEGVDIDELAMEMEVDRVAREEQERMEAEQRAMELMAGASLGAGDTDDDEE